MADSFSSSTSHQHALLDASIAISIVGRGWEGKPKAPGQLRARLGDVLVLLHHFTCQPRGAYHLQRSESPSIAYSPLQQLFLFHLRRDRALRPPPRAREQRK